MKKQKETRLVLPREEWPYEVPKNWVWTTIASIFDVTSSKRVHKDDWLKEGIPFYRTRELVKLSDYGTVDNELFISREMYEAFKKNFGVPQIGDILISGVGTIGVPFEIQSNDEFYFKDGNVVWFKKKKTVNSRYIYHLYKSEFLTNQLHNMSGGTTVDTYTIVNAKRTLIPLPPLPEQQRIVARIESLFSKLDTTAEKIRAALDQFPIRKAAILHKAFTGELTKKWREEHGVGMESWERKTFQNLGETKLGKMLDKAKNLGHPTKYLRNINVRWFSFSFEDVLELLATEDERKKFSIEDGDVLICECGEPGRCAVWTNGPNTFIYQKALHRFRPYPDNLSQFIAYNLYYLSISGKLESYYTGTTIKHLTGKSLAKLSVPVPTLPEQKEIVRILDVIFDREQKAKEAAEHLLENIDLTKKSILARAFRGKLGTNDPKEASAEGLLKYSYHKEVSK